MGVLFYFYFVVVEASFSGSSMRYMSLSFSSFFKAAVIHSLWDQVPEDNTGTSFHNNKTGAISWGIVGREACLHGISRHFWPRSNPLPMFTVVHLPQWHTSTDAHAGYLWSNASWIALGEDFTCFLVHPLRCAVRIQPGGAGGVEELHWQLYVSASKGKTDHAPTGLGSEKKFVFFLSGVLLLLISFRFQYLWKSAIECKAVLAPKVSEFLTSCLGL